jgi:hypothetical protein
VEWLKNSVVNYDRELLWFQRVGNDGSDDLFTSVQAGVSGQRFSVGQEPVAITLKSKEVVYGRILELRSPRAAAPNGLVMMTLVKTL